MPKVSLIRFQIKKLVVVPSGVDGDVEFFVFSGSNEQEIIMKDVEEFLAHDYESFDDFAEMAFRIWQITSKKNAADWKQATCITCPAYFAKYMCKHIVGISYRLQILKPTEVEPISRADKPIEPKKQRGRPKKATPALQID